MQTASPAAPNPFEALNRRLRAESLANAAAAAHLSGHQIATLDAEAREIVARMAEVLRDEKLNRPISDATWDVTAQLLIDRERARSALTITPDEELFDTCIECARELRTGEITDHAEWCGDRREAERSWHDEAIGDEQREAGER